MVGNSTGLPTHPASYTGLQVALVFAGPMAEASERPAGLRPSQASANSCDNMRQHGRCKFGDDCFYAHSQEESELFVQWARTQKVPGTARGATWVGRGHWVCLVTSWVQSSPIGKQKGAKRCCVSWLTTSPTGCWAPVSFRRCVAGITACFKVPSKLALSHLLLVYSADCQYRVLIHQCKTWCYLLLPGCRSNN